jgi:molybdate/tungstate transport system substrate-binding protein
MKLETMRSFICAAILFLSSAGARSQHSEQQLIIFQAGSLSIPFEHIIEGFQNENPGVTIHKETAGSRECAKKISELHKPCDIFASADYQVIDSLLIPQYADWNIKFASNEMVIAYKKMPHDTQEITRDNWFDILMKYNFHIGRADPDADPCGYRTIMAMKLAEIYYHKPGLAHKLLVKDTRYIRSQEADLLALLESGEIDFVFLYRSVAQQRGLKFLALPDEINLKRPEMNALYRRVSVELSGPRPGSKITQYGKSMVYGVTIPTSAPNPVCARKFVEYLLSADKGLKALEQMGQPAVVPSVCDQFDQVPSDLRRFAIRK